MDTPLVLPWQGLHKPLPLYRFWFRCLTTPSVPTFQALSELHDAWIRYDREKRLRSTANLQKHDLLPDSRVKQRIDSHVNALERSRLAKKTRGAVAFPSFVANALPLLFFQVILPLLGHAIPALAYAAPEGSTLVNAANAGIGSRLAGAAFYGVLLGFFAMAGFEIASFMRNLSARLLGGQGRLSRIRFVTAAFVGPLAVIAGLFRTIPVVGLIVLGLRAVYGALLSVPAIRAVYGLRPVDAVLSAIVGLLPGMLVMAVVARLYL